ncbi:MAG TPA: NeuD/PglB/VioB family sugar acetyltransferase [Stellaceae bacterium]|nr:NeuD/PglB/VioB family sugar acetyltransferase [Stellaceae bacterium]
MKSYDKVILDHYREVAEHAGLNSSATMADNRTRQLETELICRFVRSSLVDLKSRGRRVDDVVIADVGCGNGYTLEVLRGIDARPKLIGYEFSPELAALAKKRFADQKIEVRHADIRDRSTLGPEPVDVLICQRVLINLLDAADQTQALRNLIDAVRPGGHLLFIEAFQRSLDNLNQARAEFDLPEIKPAHHNRYLDEQFFAGVSGLGAWVGPESDAPDHFLSSHYFVSRVLHPILLGSRPFRHNSLFVRFMSEAVWPQIGDFAPVRAKAFTKPDRSGDGRQPMPSSWKHIDAGVRSVLLGGGGHAAMVIEAMKALGHTPTFLLDRDREQWGSELLGVPVLGGDDRLTKGEVTHFVVTHGSIGPGGPRQDSFEKGLAAGLEPLAVVHPGATVSPSASIGAGTVVLAGAAVSARAVIGRNAIINTGAIVEHHCHIGNHVHVASGSRLCGQVSVGDRALIGAGATVRQSIAVGSGALVAAGSVVVKDVAPNAVVMGVPARPRKKT